MPADEPTIPLYDFLYRDPQRIASLYAQFFGGHLLNFERSRSAKTGREKGAALAAFVSGSLKSTGEEVEGNKETLLPHDVLTVDLIHRLLESRIVRDDFSNAPNGAIIRAAGSLSFGDGSILKLFAESMESEIVAAAGGGKSNQADKRAAKLGAAVLKRVVVPSIFELACAGDQCVIGSIKDEGLEEPIGAYYHKHGANRLPDIQVIGIKEVGIPGSKGTETSLVNMTHAYADALCRVFFPASAVRVTPLMIFRRIRPDSIHATTGSRPPKNTG